MHTISSQRYFSMFDIFSCTLHTLCLLTFPFFSYLFSSLNFSSEVLIKYMVMLGCHFVLKWGIKSRLHALCWDWSCWLVGLWVGTMGDDLPVSSKDPKMSVSVVSFSFWTYWFSFFFFFQNGNSASLTWEGGKYWLGAPTGSWAEKGSVSVTVCVTLTLPSALVLSNPEPLNSCPHIVLPFCRRKVGEEHLRGFLISLQFCLAPPGLEALQDSGAWTGFMLTSHRSVSSWWKSAGSPATCHLFIQFPSIFQNLADISPRHCLFSHCLCPCGFIIL